MAILDRVSRKILAWRLHSTLEAEPCVRLLKEAIRQYGPPVILNTDQGSQFTSELWVRTCQEVGIQLSMAGKGRCYDNIHMERFWRSLKQEEVYLTEYQTLQEAKTGIGRYMMQYNHQRPHQALNNRTPASVYATGCLWEPPRQTIVTPNHPTRE